MKDRNELKKLVFVLLNNNGKTAREIYEELRHNQPGALREGKVGSFRSFVKVVNSFKEVKAEGNKPFIYKFLQ